MGSILVSIPHRCKEGSDIWIPCNKLPEDAQHCKYTVDGLITGNDLTQVKTVSADHGCFEGQTYFFRVRAVNRVGEGDPSSSSCFATPGEDWGTASVSWQVICVMMIGYAFVSASVEERQNAMLDSRRRKLDAELAIKRALEEQERREGSVCNNANHFYRRV